MSRVAEQRCSVSCCTVMLCDVLYREPVDVAVVVTGRRCCFLLLDFCVAMRCNAPNAQVVSRCGYHTRPGSKWC
jgi:hypothetical protein